MLTVLLSEVECCYRVSIQPSSGLFTEHFCELCLLHKMLHATSSSVTTFVFMQFVSKSWATLLFLPSDSFYLSEETRLFTTCKNDIKCEINKVLCVIFILSVSYDKGIGCKVWHTKGTHKKLK